MTGNADKVWVGYAADQAVRLNAASGGIITGTLIWLLEKGLIDGAVVNIPDPNRPPRGKSILAKTKAEILYSAKSIYCMTEIQRGLRVAVQDTSVKNLVVVGLPCQIADFKKQVQRGFFPFFKDALCIGLMCGHNVTASATVEALKQSNIDIADVQEIRYRAYGWYPYTYSVKLKNGGIQDFPWLNSPLQKIWESLKYQPQRCQKCFDFTAEKADIACCDAWLDEYRGDMEGHSIVLAHTRKGMLMVEKLIEEKALFLKVADMSCLQRSQHIQLERKRNIRKELKNYGL